MTRLHGNFKFTVDNKGRINIPSRFRSAINSEVDETFVICRGPGGCLRVYTSVIWEEYETKLLSRPETKEMSHFKRLLDATLTESKLDAQGRIALSAAQMEIAGIVKEVTLIGRADFIEIWDAGRFESYQKNHGVNFDSMFYQSVGGETSQQ
ncbi:MAG: division/cell wall cluster transcriptional repressor MraZ [Chitinispirillaceae bacterium]|nr:division/cell wall cluster transcriptional repressor MraZ [Chitinispirillaceae bacterium]